MSIWMMSGALPAGRLGGQLVPVGAELTRLTVIVTLGIGLHVRVDLCLGVLVARRVAPEGESQVGPASSRRHPGTTPPLELRGRMPPGPSSWLQRPVRRRRSRTAFGSEPSVLPFIGARKRFRD